MQDGNRDHATLLRARWAGPLLIVIVLLYLLAIWGATAVTFSGAAVSSLALLLMGGAIYLLCLPDAAQERSRPGARAATMHRRYRLTLWTGIGMLYLVLVAGTMLTDRAALTECLSLPLCAPHNDLASLAIGHRVLALIATLFLALLLYQTWRMRPEPALRRLALAAGACIMIQNMLGIVQVLLGPATAVLFTRGLHLALGAATWGVLVALGARSRQPPDQLPSVEPAPSQSSRMLKDYISLTKPGVITLLIFTTLAGMLITPAGIPPLSIIVWTLLGGWLMPSGAHALNCYFDRDIDIRMGRTGRRPLPSNRIPAWHALVLGLVLTVLAFAILAIFVNMLTACLALAGHIYYVGIYTLWLKRSSPSNIVIGGGAGAFPPLVGWAAATGSLSLPCLFLFAIIFYWTPPHFWALAIIRKKDYANAGVPMLPVVAGDDETKWQIILYTILMILLSLMLTPVRLMGLPYLLMALILGGVFARYALRLWRAGTTAAAWGLYKFSLLYVALLFSAMMLDRLLF